jgi:hypothetical protein
MVGCPRQPNERLLSRPNRSKKLTSPHRCAAPPQRPRLHSPSRHLARCGLPELVDLPPSPPERRAPRHRRAFTPMNSTHRRDSIPKQQQDITLKAHVANACLKCFRGMLQVSYADVAKVDRDVAHVAMVVHVCCKLLF